MPDHLWFKARAFGWGWTPVTVEGRIVVFAFLALTLLGIGVFTYEFRAGASVRSANLLFMGWLGLIVGSLILVSWPVGVHAGVGRAVTFNPRPYRPRGATRVGFVLALLLWGVLGQERLPVECRVSKMGRLVRL